MTLSSPQHFFSVSHVTKRSRDQCAVGSHSTLSAGGQGALGDRVPHKIEMFYNDMVKRSDKQKQTKTHQYHAKTDKERRTAYA